MNVSAVRTVAKAVPVFEFEELAGLPCGCVTAAYRSAQWDVTMVSVEAKGPHCILPQHFVGQVLRLGDTLQEDLELEPGEDE
jgi:hypothetical protein